MAALLTSVREGCLTCRGAVIAAYVRYSSTRTSVTRTKRSIYVRTYPTIVVLPDGATINIRYKEPRGIIKLPLDLETLSAQERAVRLERRKPKQKIIIQEEIEDTYDVNRYSHLWKRH